MAKLAFLVALAHATLISGHPTRDVKRMPEPVIKIESNLDVTTSYSSPALSSLQTATATLSPSLTGVSLFVTQVNLAFFPTRSMPEVVHLAKRVEL